MTQMMQKYHLNVKVSAEQGCKCAGETDPPCPMKVHNNSG